MKKFLSLLVFSLLVHTPVLAQLTDGTWTVDSHDTIQALVGPLGVDSNDSIANLHAAKSCGAMLQSQRGMAVFSPKLAGALTALMAELSSEKIVPSIFIAPRNQLTVTLSTTKGQLIGNLHLATLKAVPLVDETGYLKADFVDETGYLKAKLVDETGYLKAALVDETGYLKVRRDTADTGWAKWCPGIEL